MAGLLDYIFSTLDIESLAQKQVKEHLCYLQEIAPQIRSIEDRIKFSGYRVRLIQRFIDLNSTTLRDFSRVLAESCSVIESKTAKYHLVP